MNLAKVETDKDAQHFGPSSYFQLCRHVYLLRHPPLYMSTPPEKPQNNHTVDRGNMSIHQHTTNYILGGI